MNVSASAAFRIADETTERSKQVSVSHINRIVGLLSIPESPTTTWFCVWLVGEVPRFNIHRFTRASVHTLDCLHLNPSVGYPTFRCTCKFWKPFFFGFLATRLCGYSFISRYNVQGNNTLWNLHNCGDTPTTHYLHNYGYMANRHSQTRSSSCAGQRHNEPINCAQTKVLCINMRVLGLFYAFTH